MNTITVTRQQLYGQMWSKPTIQLAKEYGVSDVALAKICRKHNIPKPPLGYWAKLQHGHKVCRSPLPETDDPDLETVHITPTPDSERMAALQPETQDMIRAERSEAQKIVVPETLVSPHPLVSRTHRCLSSAKPDDCGIVRPHGKRCLHVAIGKDSIDRAMLIMDTLLKEMEARDMRVAVHDDEFKSVTLIEVEGETIDVRMTELLSERWRELTPEQSRENEEYSVLQPHRITEQYPCGLLVVSLKGGYRASRHRCSDADDTRLEDKLNGVMAWLYKEADRIKSRRQAQEEQSRLWAEQQKQREEQERQRREEKQRLKQFRRDVVAWHKAERMRAYVVAVEEAAIAKTGPVDPESDVGRWLTWARTRIVEIDPIKT